MTGFKVLQLISACLIPCFSVSFDIMAALSFSEYQVIRQARIEEEAEPCVFGKLNVSQEFFLIKPFIELGVARLNRSMACDFDLGIRKGVNHEVVSPEFTIGMFYVNINEKCRMDVDDDGYERAKEIGILIGGRLTLFKRLFFEFSRLFSETLNWQAKAGYTININFPEEG